jgi:hypothetical protein
MDMEHVGMQSESFDDSEKCVDYSLKAFLARGIDIDKLHAAIIVNAIVVGDIA